MACIASGFTSAHASVDQFGIPQRRTLCSAQPRPALTGHARPRAWLDQAFFLPGFGSPERRPAAQQCAQRADRLDRLRPHAAHLCPQAARAAQRFAFSYPTAPLAALVQALRGQHQPVQLLVAAGAGQQALAQAAGLDVQDAGADGLAVAQGALHIRFLPFLAQTQFDALLGLCDLHLVRGEDSLAQALQAGQPSVWQIYPQADGAHEAKLQAYLDAIGASACERAWHAFWNAGAHSPWPQGLQWPWEAGPAWAPSAPKRSETLRMQDDLCTRLLSLVHRLRGPAPGP